MSPLDEIRWLNRKKKRGDKLSPYQKWVVGGCRGPSPARGACPRTKPPVPTAIDTLLKDIDAANGQALLAFSAIRSATETLDRAVMAFKRKPKKSRKTLPRGKTDKKRA